MPGEHLKLVLVYRCDYLAAHQASTGHPVASYLAMLPAPCVPEHLHPSDRPSAAPALSVQHFRVCSLAHRTAAIFGRCQAGSRHPLSPLPNWRRQGS